MPTIYSYAIDFDAADFDTRAPRGPYTHEISAALEAHLKKKDPALLLTDVEVLLTNAGFGFYWTPPYCPQYQPIELMWGKSKGECATDWYPKRGIEGTYLALMKSWYGGPGRSHLYYHSQITAAQCEKCRAGLP